MINVESLHTNNPIEGTTKYIIQQTCIQNSLTPIYSNLIFKKILVKLATECTFKFNKRFLKQVNFSTVIGRLSVTFSDIYMVKMENDIVIPSKPVSYRTVVDDNYSGRKIGDNALFNRLNNYCPNIKLTIKLK